MHVVQEKTEDIISLEESIYNLEKILWDKKDLLKKKLGAITSIFCDKCTESVSIDQIVVTCVYTFEKAELGWFFSHYRITCPACGNIHNTDPKTDLITVVENQNLFKGFREEFETDSLIKPEE